MLRTRLAKVLSRVLPLLLLPALAHAQGGRGPARDRTPAPIGTAEISGSVVSADTGRPVRLARVVATAPELPTGRAVQTDESGHYQLRELPAGRYTVAASKAGFVSVNFGQRRPLRAGRPVEVRDGQRLRDIDFRLPRSSAINGRVTDFEGEPIVRASVRALRVRSVEGESRIEATGSGQTDDRGQFRIYGLQPGNYYVSVSPPSDDGAGRADRGRQDGGDLALSYAPTYYPGVSNLSAATQITLPLADEVSGLHLTMQLVPSARVSGIVIGPAGAMSGAFVQLITDESGGMSGWSFGTSTARDGTFTIPNVPPGDYTIVGRDRPGRGETELYCVMPLSVHGGTVSGITLALTLGVTITGQVTFEGAASPTAADLARIRIGLWIPAASVLPVPGGQAAAGPRADGTFTMSNVGLPGTPRRFRVTGVPRPWALKAVYLDGRDVTDDTFDLRTGEATLRANVVLTDQGAAISGTVRDAEDRPLTDATVIAFAADAQYWRPLSRFIQAVRPDKDGVYTLRGLPPGEYLLQALDDVEPGEWYDPTLLESLRARAARIVLQQGDTKTVDVRLATVDR
jgi:hypothetical protein